MLKQQGVLWWILRGMILGIVCPALWMVAVCIFTAWPLYDPAAWIELPIIAIMIYLAAGVPVAGVIVGLLSGISCAYIPLMWRPWQQWATLVIFIHLFFFALTLMGYPRHSLFDGM